MKARRLMAMLCVALPVACTPRAEMTASTIKVAGVCDASALIPVGNGRMLLASDESNIISTFDARSGGPVQALLDLGPFLRTDTNKRGRQKEADLEAGAQVGKYLFWIASHGNDGDGDPEPSRHRFFASEWNVGDSGALRAVGQPVTGLLLLMMQGESEPARALRDAARKAHRRGGVDIEGLAGTPQGTVLIGFRSPLVNGKAMVVEFLNPIAATLQGEAPRLGVTMLVDLGGRGIRDMVAGPRPGEILVLAGPSGTEGNWSLLRWRRGEPAGKDAAVTPPAGVAWEGLALDPETGDVWLAADDGDAGSPICKERPPKDQSFRLWRGGRP